MGIKTAEQDVEQDCFTKGVQEVCMNDYFHICSGKAYLSVFIMNNYVDSSKVDVRAVI